MAEIDDRVLMQDNTGNYYRCHFAGTYEEDGTPRVWICGQTSWSVVVHPVKTFKPTGGFKSFKFI